MFGQAKRSDDYQSTGIGLGLTYCKQIVELYNGDISCDSTEKQGTTFTYHINVGCPLEDYGLSEIEHQ